jgi:two-component system, OmpR family, phosphate regulon sensor histidine kinase PhoR
VHWFSLFLGLSIGGLFALIDRARLRKQIDQLWLSRTHNSPQYANRSQSDFSLSSYLSQMLTVVQEQQRQQQVTIAAWRSVIYEGPWGYLLIDEDNQLIEFNPEAMELLHVQLDQADYQANQPRLLLEIVRSYELDRLIEDTRDRQETQRKEWRLYPVNPDIRNAASSSPKVSYLRGQAFPLPNDYIAVLLESRQEEVQLSKQRDRWASDVAHELKTPLTSIRLVAETLQTRVDPSLRQWLDRLLSEAIRLSNLVQETLDLSQLESQTDRRLPRTSVDLPQLIQSAWRSLEPIAQAQQIQLNYEGPHTLIIQAHESRLFRVVLNLLDNSLKASPAKQRISVIVKQRDHDTQIEIIDAGTGFATADLPLIFDRFYRGDPSRARPAGDTATLAPLSPASSGSGLGLAIVRQIIELHGGGITARNHPETGGAWIRIRLPL